MSNDYTNAPRGATSDATDLDELERVVAGATAGKLSVKRFADRGYALVNGEDGVAYVGLSVANAEAFVETWNAWPALLIELRALRGALHEAREVIALCTTRTFDAPEDPEVAVLGERIGFGALMSAASKEWARANACNRVPFGSQHTSGPCESTVWRTLEVVDAALSLAAPEVPRG